MPMKNPPHPGRIVRKAIDDLGHTYGAAADHLGISRKTLSAIMNEHASITPDMAVRFEKGIGSSAVAWLRMQSAYDLSQAQKAAATLRVRKLEPVE